MKKYLLGLGVMLVGAGLVFICTHTQVSAESLRDQMNPDAEENRGPEPFACSRNYVGDYDIQNCKTSYLDCAVTSSGVSCVKRK
jgi:hypothetical protein